MRKQEYKIDIVIPWVNGGDKKWLEKKNKYLPKEEQADIDAKANRYRDWDNLQYIFRGIEKFCPWVNKVYLITDNQKPEWINEKCEKLAIVDHKDYIPEEYLPTFSSRPIELNIHRIKGLSEHFIYMNDDFFFTKPTKVTDFFVKGMPRLVAKEKPYMISQNVTFDRILANNVRQIMTIFDKTQVKKENKSKWYKLSLPLEFFMNKFYDYTARTGWAGFYMDHLPAPFLKSKIQECWNVFGEKLKKISQNKFRSQEDVNQYLFTEYLLCTGCFYPEKSNSKGKLINLKDGNVEYACKLIKKQKYKMLCLNDFNVVNFEQAKDEINNAFDKILIEKSNFEL